MDSVFSKMVKSGRITYFLDVKEAKNNSKYLTITSSQPSKEDPTKFSKRSINLFSNAAEEFIGALKEGANLESQFSRTVKSGKITYFVDVKEAKNNSKYLTITSSQPSKEDPAKFTRRSIAVFDRTAGEFLGAVQEAAGHMK
ncbi:MAG: DUF3276 family protein [Bacteroidota bacterium]